APRRAPLLGLAACVAAGVAGEVAFGQAVTLALGQAPLRLPHLAGHLIEMGPGLDLLRAECGAAPAPFALCAYLDRLPVDWVSFLFDSDPARGVFGAADAATKRLISAEQTRFALAALAHDPWGTATGLLRDGLEQVVTFATPDVIYTPKRLDFFAHYFPASLAEAAPFTLLQTHPWIASAQAALSYLSTALALAVTGLALARPGPAGRDPAWAGLATLAWVVLAGLVVNGVVCGVLASPYGRFQARVIWLLPLVAIALVGLRLRASARRPVAALGAA
ncbi:hypothetical protein, partial [Paracraurococcus ruber]